MPELPEVETVRRGLEATVVGRRITGTSVTGARSVRRQPAAELRARLEGRTVTAVTRKGKFLALKLDDGQVLVIHLRMSGQLLHVRSPRGVAKAPHTHIVARLDDGSELRFVDPRTFGEWWVTEDTLEDGSPALFDRLGPDPYNEGLTAATLASRLENKRTPVKAALTDQRVVAGIGSIYADEICWRAKVRPDRRADSLIPREIKAIARATLAVLASAVEHRGSSLKDASYKDLTGEAGSYQDRHEVYDKKGRACSRCGTPIARLSFGARTAYCCENCQH
jgi:formamidopyrimidine-DNA glycosylase